MRTEEQKLARAPVVVVLGGKETEIRILSLSESREWKQKVAKLLNAGFSDIKTDSSDPDKFGRAIMAFMIESPETLIDLFFSYAKDLNREEIEKVATEEEIGIAWDKVREVAFPLAQSLVQTMNTMLPQEKPSSSS